MMKFTVSIQRLSCRLRALNRLTWLFHLKLLKLAYELLVNAARAQLGQGMILTHGVINSYNDSKILRLYVLDQGKDVPKQQSVLIEPWQSDDQEGHGLGLMIARSSLEQYNGSLEYIPKKDRLLYLDNDTVVMLPCFCLSIPLLIGSES